MRRTAVLALAAAVVLPLSAFAQANSYYDRSYTRMSYVQGDVFVQRTQDLGYEQGQVNLVVVEGDKLGTKAGRLEIQLGLRNYLRLDNDTQVELAGLPDQDGQPTKIHILVGGVFVRVATMDIEKNFEIHTPDGSFYILREGLYRIDVRPSRETGFSVYEGAAEAAGQEGSIVVEERQRVSAADGRFTSEPFSLIARRDDFSAWNDTREALFARKTTQSYLPAEYSDYETELDSYGSWVDEADYGYVWVPRVLDSVWRPYTSGRWAWYPIIGWTWVSYDPWGWCTNHYGRWGWRFGLGWYWIPQNHWGWGPAWVNWWYDGDYIGWCPLSYYDRPAVIINNTFFGRHQYNDFRSFSRTLNVVRRDQLQNRRLSNALVGADRFSGRADGVNFRADQPNVRRAVGGDSMINARAAEVLSGRNARTVERGYAADGRQLSAGEIRSSSSRGAGAAVTGAGSRVIRDGGTAARTENPGRSVSGRTQDGVAGSSSSSGRASVTTGSSPIREYGSGSSSSGSAANTSGRRSTDASARTIRSYPSSGSSASRTGAGTSRSSSLTSRDSSSRSAGSSMREYPATTPRSSGSSSGSISRSSSREFPSSSVRSGSSSSPSRTSLGSSRSSGSSSREYPTSSSSRISSAPSRSSSSSASSSRVYSAPSRNSSSSSSRISSAPARSSSSSSRSYSAPSRSSSSPSRSYSAPSSSSSSRSYSAPSRSSSSSSSSRSYSAPSRSSSSSSRVSSAPSRSSSSSSRSYSAPSRSSSSSSRVSGSSSRSSSGGSSSRSSSGSASRSSSGSSRRR